MGTWWASRANYIHIINHSHNHTTCTHALHTILALPCSPHSWIMGVCLTTIPPSSSLLPARLRRTNRCNTKAVLAVEVSLGHRRDIFRPPHSVTYPWRTPQPTRTTRHFLSTFRDPRGLGVRVTRFCQACHPQAAAFLVPSHLLQRPLPYRHFPQVGPIRVPADEPLVHLGPGAYVCGGGGAQT